MNSEKIIRLLAKKLGRDASDKELAELEELLLNNPEHHFFVEVLKSIEGEKSHREPVLNEKHLLEESWFVLQNQLDKLQKLDEDDSPAHENQKILRKIAVARWLRNAAVWGGVILLCGCFFVFYHTRARKTVIAPEKTKITEVTVPFGTPEKRVLPDQSEVWLNAGSHISYADDFIENRKVFLTGEAYFSVKHDAGHPFIVYAGNIAIKALGTKFNVHAYENENKIEATLISGKVQVTIDGNPDKKIILSHNEKLTVTNEEIARPGTKTGTIRDLGFQVQKVAPLPAITAVSEIAWLQDKLAFQNEAFDDLSKRMERRFNIEVIFRDTTLEKERITGVFENETIEKALLLLQMTTPFNYNIKGDTVYLTR